MSAARLSVTLPAALLAAACAAPEPAPVAEAPPPATAPAAAPPAPPAAAARPEAKPRPKPIPNRPLNVLADCRFRNETGYNGTLKLTVKEARVRAFEARVNIPHRGSCRFDLWDFRQTRQGPGVELAHRRNSCVVRMWEQGERVTVAFQRCEAQCSGSAHPHLWPILADRRDGSCA